MPVSTMTICRSVELHISFREVKRKEPRDMVEFVASPTRSPLPSKTATSQIRSVRPRKVDRRGYAGSGAFRGTNRVPGNQISWTRITLLAA
jgi:hypothetical protein